MTKLIFSIYLFSKEEIKAYEQDETNKRNEHRKNNKKNDS